MENHDEYKICESLKKLYEESEGRVKTNALVYRAYINKVSFDSINEKVTSQINAINAGIYEVNPNFKETSKNYEPIQKLISETIENYKKALIELSDFYNGKIEQLILRRVELEASLVGALLNEEYLYKKINEKTKQKENDEVKSSVKENVKNILEKIKIKKQDNSPIDTNILFKAVDAQDVIKEVEVKNSENLINAENSKNILYGLNEGVLSVDFEKKSIICIGFCFNNRKTILYLPKEYSKSIVIDTASGDINIDNFSLATIDVSTASGEVDVIGAKEGDVSTVSGEVNLRDIPLLKVKTISGDIEIYNVVSLEGSSVSGEVNVTSLKSYINFKTTSGDYELNDIHLDRNSKISSISGEVQIDGLNLVYVNTSTISGEVQIGSSDRKSEIELSIKTTSGDIEVN